MIQQAEEFLQNPIKQSPTQDSVYPLANQAIEKLQSIDVMTLTPVDGEHFH